MSSKQLAIIDYGMGNLHSVASALKKVAPDVDVIITSEESKVANADHVIFPGVGAIRDCMAEILRRGVDKMVLQALADQKPMLGICVGMQALMQSSDENGGIACLGLMHGKVARFPPNQNLKVPHMGWNQVHQTIDHPMWFNIAQDSRFYFVHSYYVEPFADYESGQRMAGGCEYGTRFCASLTKGSAFAVQFHPEKSHTDGLQLLKNFINWKGQD